MPFHVVIPDDEQDRELPDKLRQELPGILRWCVDGCLAWQRDGLTAPAEVRDATAEYRCEQDVLGAFLAECCQERRDCDVSASTLYDCYKHWCEVNGEYRQTQRRFGIAMTERGFERYTRDGSWYRGVGLRDDG